MALQASTQRIPLDCAAIIDEGAERAGLDPSTLEHRKLVSLMRSIVLMTIEIEGSDADEEDYYDQILQQFQAGQRAAVLPADTMDVMDAVSLLPAAVGTVVNGVLPTDPGTNPDADGTTKIPMIRVSRAEDIYQQQVVVANQVPLQYWVTRTAQPNPQLITETLQTGFGTPAFGLGPFGGLVSTTNLADSVPMVDVMTGELYDFEVPKKGSLVFPEINPTTGKEKVPLKTGAPFLSRTSR